MISNSNDDNNNKNNNDSNTDCDKHIYNNKR